MAKEKEEKDKDDKPVEWTPDQPIPDEDGETEAQRRHQLSRRMKYLDEQAEKSSKKKPDGKERKPWLLGA